MKIKLGSIINNRCDVRKYMRPDVSDDNREYLLKEMGIDDETVEAVLKYAQIYININDTNRIIIPYDFERDGGQDEN